nr:GEVED domain-containing protein [Rhodopirellula sp. SM50]
MRLPPHTHHRIARRLPCRRRRLFEQLERRNLLAAGFVELGASDNIALDQPRVAVEFAADVDPGPGVRWESLGPDLFNTFLLDTGASSILTMATAIADMEDSPVGYDVQGQLLEGGVAGEHLLDVSVPYRFDFAGSNGERHTLLDTRVMSDATKDFSQLGPWGLAGMPAMEGRVTSLDFTGWSGGGVDLDSIYMETEFRTDVPASNGHRYTIELDNRLSFDPLDQMVFGEPPIWGDVPFMTGIPEHNGIAQAGNFLFDTGAQISLLSERLAIDIGLDSNGDGLLDQNDSNFVTQQVVGGVGGQISVPVFGFDEFHLPTASGVDLVWTDLQWLVLDIDIPGQASSLDGVFGSDLLTSGWFHAFFSPGQPDGYINQVHMDFRTIENDGTGLVHFDLNPDFDQLILPGPGFIIRQSFSTTDVGEGGENDSYNIVLSGAPTTDVVVTLENADGQVTAENAVDGSNTLVFTPDNWDRVQTVLVKAVDDLAAEGNDSTLVTHTVTSDDPGYHNRAVPDVIVRIIDDDLNLLEITSDQAGTNPITSIDAVEDGDEVFYWVALSEQPEGATYVAFADGNQQSTAIRLPDRDLLFGQILEFNTGNWDRPQQIALSAVNDAIKEGPHETRMVHTVIDGRDPFDLITVGATPLVVNITDDDQGVVSITQIDGTNLSESGTTDTYQITLNLAPRNGDRVEVTVQADGQTQVSSDNGLTYGSTRVLTFTDSAPQTITVRAIDDAVAEDTHFGRITHAVTGLVEDSRYPADLPIDAVMATILDNESAGLSFSSLPPSAPPPALLPEQSLADPEASPAQSSPVTTSIDVNEAGGETTYWVSLSSQPQFDVTVFLNNANAQLTAVDAAQPANAFLTFDDQNWNTPQAVRVIAIDDEAVEGLHRSRISHDSFSADSAYRGSVLLPVEITDDDRAEFGDAPAPYPSLIRDDGAYHVAVGPQLGPHRDDELDATPSVAASGDDQHNVSDEDGVMFGTLKLGQSAAGVNIDLYGGGDAKIDAWIDFNADGIWEAGEQILNGANVLPGLQTLNYAVPATMTLGQTYARVRASSLGGLQPTGRAEDGEVEDYLVTIREDVTFAIPPVTDNLSLRLAGSNVELFSNTANETLLSKSVATTQSLLIDGTPGDDTIIVDYGANGFFAFPDGVVIRSAGGSDSIFVQGTGSSTASLRSPDGTLAGAIVQTREASTVNQVELVGVGPVSLRAMQSIQIDGPLNVGDQTLSLDSTDSITLGTVTAFAGGRIESSGPITIGGTLRFQPAAGVTPSAGDSYVLMTASALNGSFDHLDLPTPALGTDWDLKVGATEVRLTLVDLAQISGVSLAQPGNATQRSQISQVDVAFEGAVDVDADAFELRRRDGDGGLVATTFTLASDAQGNSVATLTFSGPLTRGNSSALVDGNYQLAIDPTKVRRAGTSVTLDGDDDGRRGGGYAYGTAMSDQFFSLYGDTDGDRDVDGQDYGRFGASFLKSHGMPGFDPALDSDGDGDVDGQDYARFGQRFLTTLPF